ncbi:MAG: hypothetical protein LWX56_03620 [Ignavibacteria bacterium]|nr:hypothetical protein [Ignavibacteria bacterium]
MKCFNAILVISFNIVCSIVTLTAQTNTILRFQEIELKQFYDTKGYIVPASNPWKLWDSSYTEITPRKEQIIKAEEILYRLIDMSAGYDENFTNRLNKKLRKQNRQYLGAINAQGEELIMIGMPHLKLYNKQDSSAYITRLSSEIIKLKKDEKFDSYRCTYKGWYFLENAEWTPFYIINLKKHELEKHSAPLFDFHINISDDITEN